MSLDPGWPVVIALVTLMALTLTAYAIAGFPRGRQALVAGVRATVQLSLAAVIIHLVVPLLWASAALIVVMFAVAVHTTSGRIGARRDWPCAALAMAAGLLPVLAIVLVTGAVPVTGIALIPICGILIGNMMTAHTLVGRRTFEALRQERGQVEAGLSLGLSQADAIGEVINRRVPEALVPGLDQVRTAGVVTLPGAFIGVMLGGGSPMQAAAAQVLVLFGIMAGQSVTAATQAYLIRTARILPADVRSVLPA